MSGFIGILNLDGAPVDRTVLKALTRSLEFRGPNAQGMWSDGAVGLGQTLLQGKPKTPTAAGPEEGLNAQPAMLGHRLWIVADARIDARLELLAALKGSSASPNSLSLSTPDSELILHAYDTWGDACVDHLLGDFCFVIWDAGRRRLFCARDQMGVKPFFYAHLDSFLLLSNTLDCLQRHPGISSRLNDLAIADFLLFEMNQDPSTTTFADIRRLPPAHTLTYEEGKISIRRYWELSVTTPVLFRREEEYIERFRELLDAAVADRVRSSNAGVLMSGGLDSPTVAASAKRIMARNGGSSEVRAYTDVFETLIPHEERHYAGLVAKQLGIPIEFFVSDDWKIFQNADQPEYLGPEPTHMAWPNMGQEQLAKVVDRGGVVLTGYGADPALCGRITVHFRQLLEKRRFGRAVRDAARFFRSEGRLSRLYISTRWRLVFAARKQKAPYPPWLNENLEKELGLKDRWNKLNEKSAQTSESAVRPEAQDSVASPMWVSLFESCDAGYSGIPAEICHPIFDLRLLSFLLALPRLPWCSDKELLREAARGVLPDRVRLRRKSPLPADHVVALLKRPESAWVDSFEPIPELECYVIRSRIPPVAREMDSWAVWTNLRPLSLNYWLRRGRFMG